MFDTLAYHSSVFYRDFTAYTSEKLEKLGLHFGLLFFLIYVGKHPGTTPSDLTEALHLDWGHSQRCITKLVENGFLTKEKAGRRYQLDLTEKGKQPVSAYSGGMQRRLHLASALMITPKVLLLDEPTVGADARSVELILSMVEHLRDMGCAIAMISHQPGELERVCSRVLTLEAGRPVQEEGNPCPD